MPLRFGVLAYPAFAFMMYFGRPSAAGVLKDAGAISPESARRPERLGVSQKALGRAVRKNLLVGLGDGRFYLDQAAARRANRKAAGVLFVTLLSFAPLVWLLW